MKAEKISYEFQVEKYISCGKKGICEKESWFCKKDSSDFNSFDETNSNSLSQVKNFDKTDLKIQIPDFLNDKIKIIIKNKNKYSIIPDWYKNLDNKDYINNDVESLFS